MPLAGKVGSLDWGERAPFLDKAGVEPRLQALCDGVEVVESSKPDCRLKTNMLKRDNSRRDEAFPQEC